METGPAPLLAASDARWIVHRYDAANDAFQFRFVPRPRHGDVPFLTDDHIGDAPLAVLARADAAGEAGLSAPLHFILHSAFCASTLLCRALDRPGVAMGLSEPVVLNDLVGLRRRREVDPPVLGRLLGQALDLLARPWSPGETVVVKPSNILNPLAAGLLTLRPDARAVLLHAPLETFLASVARKGMWCRLWARELLEGYLTDGAVDLGFEARDHFRQTDLQVAAVGWLAQHALFHGLVARFGSRVRTLDSEAMLADPQATIARIGAHFGLPIDAGIARAMAEGPAFHRHSKFGGTFSADDRAREQLDAAEAHREEIESVAVWARAVATNAGLALTLPATL